MKRLCYRNIGDLRVTFEGEDAVREKLKSQEVVAVALTKEATVGLGADGDPVFGFAYLAESDGCVGVAVRGFVCDVKGTVAVGDSVVLDGQGGVKKAASGKGLPQVVAADSDEGNVVFLR